MHLGVGAGRDVVRQLTVFGSICFKRLRSKKSANVSRPSAMWFCVVTQNLSTELKLWVAGIGDRQ
jgi:hypothetical protein